MVRVLVQEASVSNFLCNAETENRQAYSVCSSHVDFPISRTRFILRENCYISVCTDTTGCCFYMEFEIVLSSWEECGCLTSCVLSFANSLSGLTHFCENTTSAQFLREATNTQPYGVEIYTGCGQTTRTSGNDATAGEKVRTKKKKKENRIKLFRAALRFWENWVRKFIRRTWTWLIANCAWINNNPEFILHANTSKKCGIK